MSMPWGAIGGALKGWNHGYTTRKQGQINERLSQVNADTKNMLRRDSNTFEAAKGNLNRFMQSVNNNKLLAAGGKALEANLVNARREADQGLMGSFSDGIRAAEAEGAARAAQAAAGVDGSVIDQINGSMALRQSIVAQQVTDFKGFRDFDVAQRAGQIMTQTIGGLDSSLILDTFDYNIDVAEKSVQMNNWAYMLRGMSDQMGGAGAVDSGLSAELKRTQEIEKESDEAIEWANQNEGNNAAELASTNTEAQDKYKFGFDAETETYNPYGVGTIDVDDYYKTEYSFDY